MQRPAEAHIQTRQRCSSNTSVKTGTEKHSLRQVKVSIIDLLFWQPLVWKVYLRLCSRTWNNTNLPLSLINCVLYVKYTHSLVSCTSPWFQLAWQRWILVRGACTDTRHTGELNSGLNSMAPKPRGYLQSQTQVSPMCERVYDRSNYSTWSPIKSNSIFLM